MAGDAIPVREGDLLAGKYRVERVIGIGGMGCVVSAMHEALGERVAIKLMLPHALKSPESVARFMREARAAARVKGKHVVQVFDVGVIDSGSPFIVMELLEGMDAGKIVAEEPMPLTRAIGVILQACVAVSKAHAAGIIHRDIKPQNLFVTQQSDGDFVKVLDFGISKDTGDLKPGGTDLTKTESMLGSPHYMSPEQLKNSKDVDARTDVYSLGVCLFQLLSTKLPFEAPSIAELCLKVLSMPPASLSKYAPSVPDEVVRIVEKCIARERDERYATVADFAMALEPFADARGKAFAAETLVGSPPSIAPSQAVIDPRPTHPTVNAWGTASSSPKKRSTLWFVMGGALIVGAGVTIGLFYAKRTKPAPAHVVEKPKPTATQEPSVAIAPLASSNAIQAPISSVSATPSASASTAILKPVPIKTGRASQKDAGAPDLFQDRN